ncbi:CopG family transcriptional regulator [uncultured Sphingomonas sp.]|uniref:ribbon-helix-helix domain-containing protein n=1 Tax=uncultured Sphingomonas sp. TaxID=158754 RepID=UPI0025D37C48|nr:CopG family transcriptional regulator [uncultured Sphingomonas sp.]
MTDELVMRSVYLRPSDDARLRELAHRLNVTKSDLIRCAIGLKLADWLVADDASILREVEMGKRGASGRRSEKSPAQEKGVRPVAVLPQKEPTV